MAMHLLNLRVLADEQVDGFSLLRFEGREAISEPFDYRIELIAAHDPGDIRGWIGKLAEFDVTMRNGDERIFSGRIYETQRLAGGDDVDRIIVRIRPGYHALAYGRATHFVQDRTTQEIFEAMVADVPGLVTGFTLSGALPKRSYAVRYDETELDFLARLLAQDGLMYFFEYERGAGTFRHRMHIANVPSAYKDVPGGDTLIFQPGANASALHSLGHAHRALAGKHDYHAYEVNQVDTPWKFSGDLPGDWGRVYSHSYEDMLGEALKNEDLGKRGGAQNEAYAQAAETITGSADNAAFFAGGRIKLDWAESEAPQRVVLTSVTHSAHDPWMLQGQGQGQATYANQFTAMDATKAFRPPPAGRLRAPGPVLGLVKAEGKAAGEAVIDSQSRVPVEVASARRYPGSKPLSEIVWLPVQQQWSHATHGAQFFPRIGARVVIDFLYGDPDLPFISGTMYNPTQKYPFDPAQNATKTGWRSVTDKNGEIVQEFLFEDKPGAEEIQLTTDRDYRRMIKNDDWGTIKHDQTLMVENDQTETVKHDQKLNVENDRTVKITGVQDTTIQKTRTVTVTQKSLLESKQEIELKVGPCSITMTLTGIVIKAPQIEIKADATLKVSAGAMAEYKAPMTQHNADAMMIIKGGMVMIN